jgi:hypothetical protein
LRKNPNLSGHLARTVNKNERGQSLVELAMVMPIFLLLVFSVIDFGMGLRAWITVTNSAREGARVGAIGGDCDAIKARAVSASSGLLDEDNIDVLEPGSSDCHALSGSSVKVQAQYEYEFVTPLGGILDMLGGALIPSSITMTSVSDMRIE